MVPPDIAIAPPDNIERGHLLRHRRDSERVNRLQAVHHHSATSPKHLSVVVEVEKANMLRLLCTVDMAVFDVHCPTSLNSAHGQYLQPTGRMSSYVSKCL